MRNLSIDYLKVMLAFSVVLLHVHFLREEIPQLGFVLVNGIFRLAVPLFLIITGYYFTQITSLEKFKSWFLRILILYVVWMIFYIPFWVRPSNIIETLLNIPIGYFILWYLVGVMFGGLLLYFSKNLKPKYLLTLA
ncbi:acyltransferase family protein [Acinetobacter cumulans]|uniref:acyltransferase family protein n=1 Tax=Acinetobacter cumulans TaxID=2136182 RepID=UPI001443D390|nr:acyltransferase family protein [Acinetobacter cumulans]